MHAYTNNLDVSPKLQSLVAGLQGLQNRWPIANRYLMLIRRALQKFDVHRTSSTGFQDSLPLAVSILLDIRKTAYEAVGEPETPVFSLDATTAEMLRCVELFVRGILRLILHRRCSEVARFDNFWMEPEQYSQWIQWPENRAAGTPQRFS